MSSAPNHRCLSHLDAAQRSSLHRRATRVDEAFDQLCAALGGAPSSGASSEIDGVRLGLWVPRTPEIRPVIESPPPGVEFAFRETYLLKRPEVLGMAFGAVLDTHLVPAPGERSVLTLRELSILGLQRSAGLPDVWESTLPSLSDYRFRYERAWGVVEALELPPGLDKPVLVCVEASRNDAAADPPLN